MKSHSGVIVLALAMVGQLTMVSARAQKADSLTKVKSEGAIAAMPTAATPAAAAPADTSAPKHHGMFGKLKSVAQNKTVQNVAKVAACQALPGGQYMVAAAEAAKDKKSIASGVASSQSCIPGMGGMSPLGGKGLGGAGVAGAAGAGGAAGGMGALGGMSAAQIAAAGGMRGMPNGGKIAASAQGLAGMQAAMAQMKSTSMATGAAGGEATTEASGEQMKLSGAVADEIKKGKLVIKKIDWVHGSPSVSAPATQGFSDLMLSAAQAMKATGSTYRVDVYMDKKYSDQDIATLGAQRTTVVVSSLQAGGQLGEAVLPGKVGKDKEERVEIVKVK